MGLLETMQVKIVEMMGITRSYFSPVWMGLKLQKKILNSN